MSEYWCHYCTEWQDAQYCQSHFESTHGQKDVTFEVLQKRLGVIGGLETRETPVEEPADLTVERKPKSWMWADEYDPTGILITNNFRHQL